MMLFRYNQTSSNISLMVPVSIFLLFVGCMVVNCDLVGHGGHWLINNKIVKLNGNTKIAENPEDLLLYKEFEGSCDVEMVEGNIRIWYQKNSATTEGCSTDLVTKNVGQLSLKFGIWHKSGLTECLGDTGKIVKSQTENHTAAANNMLPFSFSLKKEEFDSLKKEPNYGINDYCENLKVCQMTDSKCLKVADYSVAWARTKDYVSNFVLLIGDGATEPCLSNERHSTVETSFDLLLNENLFGIEDCNSKLALSCSKKENIRKPEEWEIVDETYKKTYSKMGFKFLFTFHILPLTAMRKSIQKFWTSCDSKEGICADDAEFQKCDKMFIEFDKENFKMLVSTEENNQNKTDDKLKINEENFMGEEDSGIKTSTIILIIIGVTIV
uniref:Uncharacterized protein n=2 Tax=Meloidogyne incognita group TaxID=654580 RepID=A0A914LIU9_MELIC